MTITPNIIEKIAKNCIKIKLEKSGNIKSGNIDHESKKEKKSSRMNDSFYFWKILFPMWKI